LVVTDNTTQMIKNLMLQTHITTEDFCNCCPHGIDGIDNIEDCSCDDEDVCPLHELGLFKEEGADA